MGPGLAGMLVGALGAPVAVIVDAVGHLASALGVAAARPERASADSRPGAATTDARNPGKATSVLEGIRVLFTDPHLRALTLHAALYNLASKIIALNLVLWAVGEQHLSTTAYGIAMGAGDIGAPTALRLSDRLGLGRAFVASLGLSCGIPVLAVA